MPRPKPWTPVLLAAIVSCAALAAATARADWPASGLPLATGPIDQRFPVGLTGPGGELHAFWVEGGAVTHVIRSQHLTIAGTPAPGWPAGGRGVVATPARPSFPELASDGAGGAILAWYDLRAAGAGPRGIYGVRVDPEAAVVPGWSATGTPICTFTTAEGAGPLNQLMRACGDGAGGAFVAWTDSRNTPPLGTLVYDVFAQHVLAGGSPDPAWPADGLGLTAGAGYKYPHALVADGDGGFWLATEQPGATWQVTVVHHDAGGAELGRWTSPSFASRVTAVSDGDGGVFAAWRDCRDCMGGSDAIFAVRLGAGAAPRAGWPAGGMEIGNAPGDDNLPVIVATGDGAAMIAWLVPGNPLDAYRARRVEADGSFAPPWQGGPVPFAVSTDILDGWPLIAPDGDGGAMFAFRRNTPNLFGSRVTADAQVPAAFPDTGLSLCALSGDQFLVSLVPDGLAGAYLMWEDRREGISTVDVYVTRFTREGALGTTTGVEPPPMPRGLALSAPRPNPASAPIAFDLTLPAAARARVEVLDTSGRRLAVLHDGHLPAGTHVLRWDGTAPDRRSAPPGIYLLQARTAQATVVRRIARLP